MNDPSHTDHDRGLLDTLEAEYLELMREGERVDPGLLERRA